MLRWGIISTGNITHSFVKDLLLLEGHKLQAVASRSGEKAISFAQKYSIPKSYDNYSKLFQDREVDIVYIATPHDSHAQLSIEAMKYEKHVLCEKPATVNSKELMQVLECSNTYNKFYMEAFWARFNPALNKVFSLIENGAIGEVNYMLSDFSFYRSDDPKGRMLNMSLAGGSLLDMGVYPLFLSYMIMGIPESIKASALFHKTGADLQTSAILRYKQGHAFITSSFISNSDMQARIYGTTGSITIQAPWHETERFILWNEDGIDEFFVQKIGRGYAHEIKACYDSISNGEIENKMWTHQNSADLIKLTDRIRKDINLVYPFE